MDEPVGIRTGARSFGQAIEDATSEHPEVHSHTTQARMHPLTLRFSVELEQAFAPEYFARTLGPVRLGLVLAIVLYAAFSPRGP